VRGFDRFDRLTGCFRFSPYAGAGAWGDFSEKGVKPVKPVKRSPRASGRVVTRQTNESRPPGSNRTGRAAGGRRTDG
jgi:hypothetical protein